MNFKSRAIYVMRACECLSIKFLLAVLMIFNSGCSYENTHADSSINIEFKQESSVELFKIVQEFASANELEIRDESKKFPSGLDSILYELVDKDGKRLFKVNDLMDAKRFVVSSYEVSGVEVQVLFKSLFETLKDKFPQASVEITRRGS